MNAQRIPAKALLITIVIILLITAITSSLVLYFYLQQQIWNTTIVEIQLQSNVDAGMQLMMQENVKTASLSDTGQIVDLYHDEENFVTTNKQQWGAFYLITARAEKVPIIKQKLVLVGYPLADSLTALYLSDQRSPLIFTDQSQIVGDCYLPKLGFKRAYFEGKTYRTDNLVQCEIKESKKELPEIDSVLLNVLATYRNAILQNITSSYDYKDLVEDSLEQSFSKQPLVFSSAQTIRIKDKVLKGKIIIISKKAIYVEPTVYLSDIILIAPKVFTRKNVKGSFQVFASDTIVIGKQNELSYPSNLFLLINDSSTVNPFMQIDSSARVAGAVVNYVPVEVGFNLKTFLAPQSLLKGFFYSNGLVCPQGTINGIAYCKQFYLKTARGYYLNYINNAVFNRPKLHRKYINPILMDRKQPLSIVKWLY